MTAGVYIHIPFCKSRCSYCDFATDVYRESGAVERYVQAVCAEIRGGNPSGGEGAAFGESLSGQQDTLPTGRVSALPVDTIYLGGGTPSLLTPVQLEKIVHSVKERFAVAPNAEITMEMNPATVTAETLRDYRQLGVNRASFGVQTFNDRDLKLLARGHDANDARLTYKLLREAGFDNVSFDLIAGLPGQTMNDWKRNLAEAVAMSPEHLSLYLLEIHEATPLAEQLRTNRRPLPDEELAAEMYEVMIDTLAAAGYEQYEISNFAKPGFASRHNSKYWTLDPVYGFGVSAHTFDGERRYSNVRDTAAYVDAIEQGAGWRVADDPVNVASEFIYLGLRLEQGIDLNTYRDRFGIDLEERYSGDLKHLTDAGLIVSEGGRLMLTRRGKLFSNEVFGVFV